MRHRLPELPAEAMSSRTSGTRARSPAERLEPTRPPARPRRVRRSREPRKSRPFLRFINGMLTLALVLMLAVGGAAYVFDEQIDAPGPLQRTRIVVIPKGDGTQEIAARLEREGIVSDRRLFIAGYLWTKFAAWMGNDKPVQLKAGDYEIRENASIRQVVSLLSEGRTASYKVTIPEGLTSHQIVERLKADQNLSGDIEVVPPEGSLLPETFVVQRGAARQSIIDSMTTESRKLVEKAWAQRRKDLPLKSPAEVVILASIIEKETGRNDERERVSAVFHNRLRQNMRLQSDPTILYGIFGGKVAWGRSIMRNEIAQKTAHNTYQIDGLPPTPICNPGRAAIEAALNPAQTKDLYFVADGSGGHVFAETLKDHNANVAKWRVIEKDMRAKAPPPAAPAPSTDTQATGAPPIQGAMPKTRAVVRKAPPPADNAKDGAKAAPAPASTWAPTNTPATQPKQ